MFCTKCGKEAVEGSSVCMGCGCPLEHIDKKTDTSAFGFGVLGFFIPVAGLILWLVWNDERPKRAKAAGIGALVSVILRSVFEIFIVVLIFAAISAASTELFMFGI